MRRDRRLCLACGLSGLALWPSWSGAAEVLHVVVHAGNPLTVLTQRELVALYTGRTRAFPGGGPARVLDHPRDSPERQAFYLSLTGMDLPRINSYWSRLHFTGQVQPPRTVAGDAAMRAELLHDPTAIGYLTQAPADSGLRVVHQLRLAASPGAQP
ncbi:MAG TPA: hypothetical protein PLF63_15025 [Rubrivivax sp.]|jgi:ABC-type phosphate transport system substrate-binding protein|nr:hypothetical protein [Rubrivivax sp.]